MKSFAIQEIAQKLRGEIIGNADLIITGPEQLEQAKETQITFIGSKKYVKFWESSKASAAIVNDDLDLQPGEGRALIKVKSADLAMAELLEMYVY